MDLWQYLIRPSAQIHQALDRRKASLLLAILVIGNVISILLIGIRGILEPDSFTLKLVFNVGILILFYFLAKSKFYRWAAILYIAYFPLVSIIMVKAGEVGFVALYFSFLSILICASLFNKKNTILLTTSIVILILIINGIGEGVGMKAQNVLYLASFLCVSAGILIALLAYREEITNEQQAEIQKSIERYKSLYNQSPVMMHSVDREGHLVSVSDYWLEVMGYRREEVLGQLITEFLSAESKLFALEKGIPHVFRTGYLKNAQLQFVKKSGEIIDVSLSAIAEKNVNGQFLRALAVLQDVTQQKQNERKVQKYAQRLEVLNKIDQEILISQTPEEMATTILTHIQQVLPYKRVMIASFDQETKTRKYLAIDGLKIDKAQIGDLRPLEPIWWDASISHKKVQIVEDLSALENPQEIETLLLANGIHSYLSFPFSVQDEIIGIMSVGRENAGSFEEDEIQIGLEIADILSIGIQQAQLYEALKNSEKKLRLMFQNSFDYILVVAPDLSIQFINRVWPHLTMEQVIGTSILHFVPEDSVGILKHAIEEAFAKGEPTTAEFMANGRWYLDRISPIKDGDHVSSVIINASDITAQKESENKIRKMNVELEKRVKLRTKELKNRITEVEALNRQLTAANEEMEGFSYSVSHDLRAPLRHINGFLGLLLRKEKKHLDEQAIRYITNATDAVSKMKHLIDDLLAFAKTNRVEIEKQSVNLNLLIDDILQELAPDYKGREIEWKISDLPLVEGDPGLLRIIMINLLSNAIKYTSVRSHAFIEVGVCGNKSSSSAEWKEDEICIYIRDNGVGFDQQYYDKLFGVFQRLHTEEEFKGTGIGLATVRRIVYRHGGRVWAEGKPDQGATFYFTIQASLAKI